MISALGGHGITANPAWAVSTGLGFLATGTADTFFLPVNCGDARRHNAHGRILIRSTSRNEKEMNGLPNKRDLKLDEYDIGKYAYRELHNFCLQYPEKKKRITELRYPYQSPRMTGLPGGTGIGDPTRKNAERAALLTEECKLIEETVKEAGGGFYQSLLVNVTNEHMPWEVLLPPCGRRQFYEARRKFFYLLFLKRGNTKDVLP